LSIYLLLPALPIYALSLGIREAGVGLVIGIVAFASMIWKPWVGWAPPVDRATDPIKLALAAGPAATERRKAAEGPPRPPCEQI
jgi:hypothetical protein